MEPGDCQTVGGASKQSAFDVSEVRRVHRGRLVIRRLYHPPVGDARSRNAAPFDVVGDTRYAKVQAKVSGKAAHQLELVYNVVAWIQRLHNRQLEHKEAAVRAGSAQSAFDVNSCVVLHQLFTLVSARYKVLTLATYDTAASETLRTLVFGHNEQEVYCPAYNFLATAQKASLVRVAAQRHRDR
ncbi:hypothetical protein BU14_0337s0008 [Porphyra umbilicalis]|uniref:Uncharacterized protein n=1 Tax=Porphyra umbilicalis TaxID=2786 RepID=A0A1X6NYV9_PORUM|nr:hypothetical protein BU14_0337s0008 [Porphyra umbilicalis]|eukprot:OSX73573.1 hypothetical protein BU14_0337s0008 [Porphyra umbilicalis]